jgi:succinate-semialdehyde dehydrogenase/glutarate-semialdehyde dehydrogenase
MSANPEPQQGVPLQDLTLFRETCFVDGHWIGADSGKRFPVVDPATGRTLGTVPDMGIAEVKRAIDAAERAQRAWAKKTAQERAVVLRKWFELLISHRDDLALLLTMEQGKPLAESKGEITYGASFIEWYAEEGKRAYGDVIPTHQPDKRILVLKQPIGVVAMITPWNFPNAMITRKAAPALAAGCTVVIKPAEQTPFSALALGVLAERAGIPNGVVNIVTGDAPSIGKELCSNPKVRKLSFTGSTEVGRILMAQSAATVKKLSLELGGNAPFIVFQDADLDAAADGAIACKYRNAGQTCVCANRLYVHTDVYDAFAAKLSERVKALMVGAGTEPGAQVGPLIDEAGLHKVEEHLSDAKSKGAKVTLGGGRHSRGGLFFEPTVVTGVTQQMRISREETFGPVAPLFRFETEEEAIELANDTEFGLAGYFYSRDIGRIFRVAEAMETGMVCVNSGILSTEVAPFGGVKQSGLGREGSKYGLEEYLEIKYLLIGGI